MKTTGYKLREALKRWQVRRDTAAAQFEGSLIFFEEGARQDPVMISQNLLKAESAIALLQTEQMRYNLQVVVSVPVVGYGALRSLTLAEVIKVIGGLGRAEKMWRAAASEKKERYSYGETSRDKDKVYAQRAISYDEAGRRSSDISRVAGAYREAIATGNATEIETDLDPALYD